MENERPSNDIKEVAKEVIGWEDNRLFITLKYLTTRPGQIISGYSKGEKQKYLSPVAYYFGIESLKSFLVSVSGLSSFVLETKIKDMRRNIQFVVSSNSTILPDNAGNDSLSSFYAFFLGEIGQKIIALPILLLLTWLFYKKYNKSIKENCWFAFYAAGHAALLTLPLILLWYLTHDWRIYALFGTIITISYWSWASAQFYNFRQAASRLPGE